VTIFLACPYCWGDYDGARFCPHCGGDTTRDAIIELTPEGIERMPRTTCVACDGPIFALATHCPHCKALQPRRA
jgi:hypothetical protein